MFDREMPLFVTFSGTSRHGAFDEVAFCQIVIKA